MSPAEIELPRPLVNQLLHLAQSSPDAEVCGLIGALNGEPSTCYPIRNAAGNPGLRFHLEPSEHIQAMRSMRERGEELFAIFHSHPTSPAIPSITDLQEANYPEALYLIISLNTKGVLEIRAFRIGADNRAHELELLLKPDD